MLASSDSKTKSAPIRTRTANHSGVFWFQWGWCCSDLSLLLMAMPNNNVFVCLFVSVFVFIVIFFVRLLVFVFVFVRFFFFCISYIFWVIFPIWPLHCLPSSIYDLWLLVWYIERCFSYSYILTQLTLSLSELTILSFKLTSTLLTKFSLFYRICASFPL